MVRARREAMDLRWVGGFVAAGLSLIAFSASASAATIPVSNTNDATPAPPGSLRAAIETANTDTDLDVIDATGVSGTINLATALPLLTEDVEIRGPGAVQLTVRRGPSVMTPFRIFNVSLVAAEISGLMIANGRTVESSFGGAGIFNNRGTVSLRDVVLSGNVNAGSSNGANGGAIHNFSAAPSSAAKTTIVDSTVSGNTTTAGYGAGVMSNSFGTVTVRNSTVSGNVAQGGAGCVGGGAMHNAGTLTVTNSTVTGNTGPPNGSVAGIFSCLASGAASNTIRNSTIAANRAGPGRPANLGLTLQGTATNTMTLKSTIVSEPLGGGPNCIVEAPATLTSQGYNLTGDASCNLTATADQPNTNPELAPLGNNGGPTRTMALLPDSPAIDQGIAGGLTTDQRGLKRPVVFPWIADAPGGDGSDIGAFEVQSLTPPEPSNEFSFGKVKKNKRKGTAKLTVNVVEGPGALELAKTKKVKSRDQSVEADGAAEEKLAIKPKGKSKRKLRRRGKAWVKAEVTYTPTGGDPNTKFTKLKLKKRR